MPAHAKLLDVVALLDDRQSEGVARGQVGTVVENLGRGRVLVEFSDDRGKTYALLPVEQTRLLVLHYEPVAA